MMLKHCGLALLLLTLIPIGSHSGNVLVFPIEGSHWLNMDIIIQALHSRGHNITVVRFSKSWYIKEHSAYYCSITIKVDKSIDKEFIHKIIYRMIGIQRGTTTIPFMSFVMMNIEAFQTFLDAHRMVSDLISTMFDDHELMRSMKESKYDLVIADPLWGGGTILAKYLGLPLVYNVRWLPLGEAHSAIAPTPLSYVPLTPTGHTDKMTFIERVKNMLLYVLSEIQNKCLIRPIYQEVCDKYLGPDLDFYQLMQAADLWLMRVDFVFEFPRPTMPNVVYMGGFQCKAAKSLPQDLEEFVQSSGEHGVIIMSLGAFVGKLPMDLSEAIAQAFAQLPQRVIWRYVGDRPSTLGNNTLLVDWMPQNDLLGHPKIKLFVAHGGTNGVQEAIYHGTPVLGIPLFFDQYDNLLRLKERGAAKILDFTTLSGKEFLEALQEVLHEPSYKVNMQSLSRLHRDQPMKPLDSALFWIEYVMRHKGAAHLRTESYRMPWYSYHSLDVIIFLLATILLILLTVFVLIRCLCIWIYCNRKIKCE